MNQDSEWFTDIASSVMCGKFKITGGNGAALGDDANVAVCNLVAGSLWSHIDLYINDDKVSVNTSSMLHIKTQIEHLLSYGSDAVKTHLTTSLFHLDTPGQFESVLAPNLGRTARKAWTAESAIVEFETPFSVDCMNLSKYLPPHCKIMLKMYRTADNIILHSAAATDTYRLEITEIYWKVRKVYVAPTIKNDIVSKIRSGKPGIYPYVRTELKYVTVPRV